MSNLVFTVYILLFKNNSDYTGYTSDVERRLQEHKNGNGGKYTRMHPPKRLVYEEKFDTRSEAMRRELEIKSMGPQSEKTASKQITKSRARGFKAFTIKSTFYIP
jgi:putative endonuclease